jgi:hypothetical protein
MPDKTVKRRVQDCDAALASDDGPIFSTVACWSALKRSIPEDTQNAELKNEALRVAHETAPPGRSTKKRMRMREKELCVGCGALRQVRKS